MHTRLSRATRFAVAAAIPFVFAAAKPVADGMSYEFVMKSTGKSTGNKEVVTMRGRGTYAGDDAKIEILEAGSSTGGTEAFGGKGTYFIVRDGGREMLLVVPKEKQYMKWDIANMFAGMSKVLNAVGGLVKMQISDVSIDAQDLGAGETVQGYPTRHIRMVQKYTVSASMFGKSSKTRSEATTDYYFAPSLRIANPFVSNSQQMAMMNQFDMFKNSDYQAQLSAAQAKLPKNGVPLKTVTSTINTDEKGKQETTVTTMEMVNFQKGNFGKSDFAVPADYKMVEMPNLNASLAAGANGEGSSDASVNGDSISAAAKAGAKDAVKDAAKDQTKQAVTKKLKGIFKR
jgi:hypothetical protein